MSVRFFKIFTGVFFVHLVVLNLVWVGFSAPLPKPLATFIYQGALPFQDTGSQTEDAWQKNKSSEQFAFDPLEASYFNHWIEIRGPSKPSLLSFPNASVGNLEITQTLDPRLKHSGVTLLDKGN